MNGKDAVEAHSDSASFTYNSWKTNGLGGMDWRLSHISQYWTGNFFIVFLVFRRKDLCEAKHDAGVGKLRQFLG